ncbi:MAG TPA: hypothetical protein VE869_05255 [Gemmatimonas sp.]|nr:hypothetical protein [Gemmatimonas sp.]
MTAGCWMLGSTRAEGQSASGARSVFDYRAGLMAVGVGTTASPAYVGRRITEGYLTQPNLFADASLGPLQFTGTLNFEGYTLRRGELNAGIYGEGFIDRRHPHTLVHEAMLGATTPRFARGAGGVRLSITGGKGFTPYGTDDPMMRPFVKYPVNHHHAQIIERVGAVGAAAIGDPVAGRGVAVEYGAFNGDEPVSPFSGPQWSRFGDSRSVRVTAKPIASIEVQASSAFVRSPGIIQGGAFDHTQRSASVRYQRAGATSMGHAHDHSDGTADPQRTGLMYALAEVARTDEGSGNARAFRYESALVEALATHAGFTLGIRAEQTERPESSRLLDPFRTTSGHIDFQIVGITRWRIATANLSLPAFRLPGLRTAGLTPFVEVASAHASARRRPAVFEPREFYGSSTQTSVSVGARLSVGTMRARMGRYGVLNDR